MNESRLYQNRVSFNVVWKQFTLLLFSKFAASVSHFLFIAQIAVEICKQVIKFVKRGWNKHTHVPRLSCFHYIQLYLASRHPKVILVSRSRTNPKLG